MGERESGKINNDKLSLGGADSKGVHMRQERKALAEFADSSIILEATLATF